MAPNEGRPRVCAVSYLNTVPLVWGALKGPQQNSMEMTFATPSTCAERVAEGVADAGILPVIESARMGLETYPEIGIACRGPVRSILLVSKVPFDQVRTLAVDTGSRTSVQLARIVLARKFRAEPAVFSAAPSLREMMRQADAALVIGDAALAVDPEALDYPYLDLGEEWMAMTGLPMVFALWSGPKDALTPKLVKLLQESCQFGLSQLDAIIAEEAVQRGYPHYLVEDYLRNRIVFELNEMDRRGLRTYLEYASQLNDPVLTEAWTAG